MCNCITSLILKLICIVTETYCTCRSKKRQLKNYHAARHNSVQTECKHYNCLQLKNNKPGKIVNFALSDLVVINTYKFLLSPELFGWLWLTHWVNFYFLMRNPWLRSNEKQLKLKYFKTWFNHKQEMTWLYFQGLN